MSKERELLQRLVKSGVLGGYSFIAEVKELLAQPEQEPVVWQYRTKPNWTGNWSKWEDCKKESYEDYIRVPLLHDWTYETRELYTSPPQKREPLDNVELLEECLYLIVAFEDGCDHDLYSNETGDAIELLRQKLGGVDDE